MIYERELDLNRCEWAPEQISPVDPFLCQQERLNRQKRNECLIDKTRAYGERYLYSSTEMQEEDEF